MFQNYSANAGIILGGGGNLIDSQLQWNFNNVIVLNYDPSDNTNDRPRINFWRSDSNYLVYMSGGLNVLTPAPTGVITQPWGDRTSGTFNLRMPISPEGGIEGGIDLFTHDFAPPSFLFPPLNSGWTMSTDPNVPNEIKYQYKFKRGEPNPNVIIILNYSGCLPPFIPTCPSGQFLSYTRINDCPTFSCYNPLAVSLGTTLQFKRELQIYPTIEYSGVGSMNFGLGLTTNYNSSWVAYGGKRNVVKIYKDGVVPPNGSNSTEQYFDLPDARYGNLQTWFGYSLDMNKDGSILVVGAPKLSISGQTERGMAQVYTGIGGDGRTLNNVNIPYNFSQLLIGDTGSDGNLDNFGSSVKITDLGNVIFVAAYGDLNDRGSIYAFTGNKNNRWAFKQKINASGFTNIDNARQGQYRNIDCSNDGSVLVVGGSLWSGNFGKVFLYTGNPVNGWIYKDSFTPLTNIGSQPEFGYSVACNNNGSIIAVGAPKASSSGLSENGLIYIYTGSKENSWNLRQILTGSSISNTYFGRCVKTNDDGNIIYSNVRNAKESQLVGIPLSGISSGYQFSDFVIAYTGNSFIGWKYKENVSIPYLNQLFGESITTSDDGTYLQIGVPNLSSPYLTFPENVEAGGIDLYRSFPTERGFLYSFPDTSWSNGTGISNIGKWYLTNNGLSQTIIGDSTVGGTRTGIGEPAFLFYPGLTLFNNYSNGYLVFDQALTQSSISMDANFGDIASFGGGINGIEFWSGTNQGDQLFRLQYGTNGDTPYLNSLYLWTGSTFKVKLLDNVYGRNIKIRVNVRTTNIVYPTLDVDVRSAFQTAYTGIRLSNQSSVIKQINFYAGGVQNLPAQFQAKCGLGVNNIWLADSIQ
jgi:hypothetical protein